MTEPTLPSPSKQALANKSIMRITMVCKQRNSLTTVEGVTGPSFQCPLCKETVVYLEREHKLGGHGVSVKNPTHELRKVQVAQDVVSI